MRSTIVYQEEERLHQLCWAGKVTKNVHYVSLQHSVANALCGYDMPLVNRIAPPNPCSTPCSSHNTFRTARLYFVRNLNPLRVHFLSLCLFGLYPLLLSHALLDLSPKMAHGNVVEIKS